MEEQMLKLTSLSLASATAAVDRLLSDPNKFAIKLADMGVAHLHPAVTHGFFERYASVQAMYSDLHLGCESLAEVTVEGKVFWRAGCDVEHVEVLVDQRGFVFEWDGQVLSGPVAPSIWHYVLWIAHLVHEEPLPSGVGGP